MLYGLLALGAIVLGLTGWLFQLQRRITRLFAGRSGQNFEELVLDFGRNLTELDRSRQEIESFLIVANERLKNSVHHIRTLRYNPFPDQGGNQRITTALLNEKGDGVIITGLHARDTMRVYAKPVLNQKSEFELTTEEQAILDDNPTSI